MSMCRTRVYLAGPVAGLTYDEAMAWRRQAAAELEAYGMEAIFPMEKEVALRDRGPLPATGVDGVPGCSADEIFEADLFALSQCQVVLANFLGAKQPSLGTAWELGWAQARGIRTYVVVENGSIHDHIFIKQGCDWLFETLEGAVLAIAEDEWQFKEARR